jgi:predicted ABC-type ATPase
LAHDVLQCRHDDALLDSWIFAGRDRIVDCVWRYGRKMVSGGQHIHRDAISTRYRRALQRLLA